MAKRALDIAVASALLVLLLPLFAVVSIALFMAGEHSIFFKQKRSGLDGQTFSILKFRTMRQDNEAAFSQTQGSQDARITALGSLLRKSSIDELPQLINVLRGEMTLVGPRPHPVELDQELRPQDPRYRLRWLVKPGLTGLAQISDARGPILSLQDLKRRLRFDVNYVREWSFMLDLKIMVRTAFYLFANRQDAF